MSSFDIPEEEDALTFFLNNLNDIEMVLVTVNNTNILLKTMFDKMFELHKENREFENMIYNRYRSSYYKALIVVDSLKRLSGDCVDALSLIRESLKDDNYADTVSGVMEHVKSRLARIAMKFSIYAESHEQILNEVCNYKQEGMRVGEAAEVAAPILCKNLWADPALIPDSIRLIAMALITPVTL